MGISIMKEIETPNLYLAAYLVSKQIGLVDTVPLRGERVIFIFKASVKTNKYINKFHEGAARVEPRNYSLICKDLKATATYIVTKLKQ